MSRVSQFKTWTRYNCCNAIFDINININDAIKNGESLIFTVKSNKS